MGVVNITPDSFSDGGRFFGVREALTQARRLADEGAAIIDIGGESTRPGAELVSEDEELRRVMPVLEKLDGLCVSVDSRRPKIMRAALEAGASMINDVDALTAPGAMEAVANSRCAVCLMHKKGEPATMQRDPHYDDVVREVREFLKSRVHAARAAGIAAERITVDPGFGFGKTAAHNLTLLKNLAALSDLPIVAVKAGRTASGVRAASSHTGALASEDRVIDAFFEKHGIWRAADPQELVAAGQLYLQGGRPRGRRSARSRLGRQRRRRDRRRRGGWCRGHGERRRGRRIEQQRELAHQPARRPVELEDHVDERLLDDTLTRQAQIRPTIGTTLQRERSVDERRVVVDARRAERVRRGNAHAQAGRFLGRDRTHLDLGAQRLAERRLHRQPPETQGLRIERHPGGSGHHRRGDGIEGPRGPMSDDALHSLLQGDSPIQRRRPRPAQRMHPRDEPVGARGFLKKSQ